MSDLVAGVLAANAAERITTLEAENASLREAAADVIAQASDTYHKRNGHLASIEGDDGEKCWIVPFDAFEQLRAAALSQGTTDKDSRDGHA